MRSHSLALAVLLLGGCNSWFAARIEPARGTFDASRRDEVWGTAKAELERRGFEVKKADPERGLLRTRWLVRPGRVPCGFVTCPYRDAVEVSVGSDGGASVRLSREIASPTTLLLFFADWFPPSANQKEMIRGIVEDQWDLLHAITVSPL